MPGGLLTDLYELNMAVSAVRLDSGDLGALARAARRMLNDARLP